MGGVVGGVAGITIIAALAFFLLRRRKSRSASESVPLAPLMADKRGDYHLSVGKSLSPSDSVNGQRSDGRGFSELGEAEAVRPELGGEGIRPELGIDGARMDVSQDGRELEPGMRHELQ